MTDIMILLILIIVVLVFVILLVPLIINIFKFLTSDQRKKKNSKNISSSAKIRLINQLRESIEFLSKTKTGAIITIENKDNLDNLRTDGVKIDASISSSLIISIFNKNSPLHDGAIIIRNGRIIYAATYYKITKKSIDNKYGSRHRAGLGISEVCDATTIIVSEETGDVSITKNSLLVPIKLNEFQEKLLFFLND
ncbi:MAG: diadenylate cyclase [Mycoplasma sp.]|nr:diadenylate cyclase [Mycoplasma sp.]